QTLRDMPYGRLAGRAGREWASVRARQTFVRRRRAFLRSCRVDRPRAEKLLTTPRSYKVFGCRPLTDGAARTGGRRPKTSKGETALGERVSVPRARLTGT